MTDIPDDNLDPRELARAEEFLARFAASRVEPVLHEMTHGFTVDHAHRILASPSYLKHFLGVAERTRPGRGWLTVAAEDSERGRLNRQLLSQALTVRTQPAEAYIVEPGDDCTVLRSPWWNPELPPEQEASVRVDGGWIIHDPWDIGKAPAIKILDGHDAWWLPEIAGDDAAVAASAHRTTAPAPDDHPSPEAAVMARLALGNWLHRWHPGTGSRNRPFDSDLLQMELGLLTWQGQYCFASSAAARNLLENLGPTIVDRYVQLQEWSGWRRQLADDVIALASRAYLETVDKKAPGYEGVARLRQSLLDTESVLSSGDLAAFRIPRSQDELALAAGGELGSMDIDLQGSTSIDPLQVSPRNVFGTTRPVLWEWILSSNELRITVAPGDQPVEELTARVLLTDDTRINVALVLHHGAYTGSCSMKTIPPNMLIDVCSPRLAVPPRSPDSAEACRGWIAGLLDAREMMFANDSLVEYGIDAADLPERPFLAEIAAWGNM